MTVAPQLTIAGNNDLAAEMARHVLASDLANPVYLWRDVRDPLPAPTPVIIIAEPENRAAFARLAIDARMSTVSLPFPDFDADLVGAIESGSLRQLSRLHGLPTLARLHRDARSGQEGRRYGIYAAHRLPRNHADHAEIALHDLLAFIASLGDGPVRHVRATKAQFDEGKVAWFVLARFANETIATVEASPVLPEADEPDGEILIEVTGSEAVLRAEPERQSVVVQSSNGVHRHQWYAGLETSLLAAAMDTLEHGGIEEQSAIRGLIGAISRAAQSDGIITPQK